MKCAPLGSYPPIPSQWTPGSKRVRGEEHAKALGEFAYCYFRQNWHREMRLWRLTEIKGDPINPWIEEIQLGASDSFPAPNTGSNPVGDAKSFHYLRAVLLFSQLESPASAHTRDG